MHINWIERQARGSNGFLFIASSWWIWKWRNNIYNRIFDEGGLHDDMILYARDLDVVAIINSGQCPPLHQLNMRGLIMQNFLFINRGWSLSFSHVYS